MCPLGYCQGHWHNASEKGSNKLLNIFSHKNLTWNYCVPHSDRHCPDITCFRFNSHITNSRFSGSTKTPQTRLYSVHSILGYDIKNHSTLGPIQHRHNRNCVKNGWCRWSLVIYYNRVKSKVVVVLFHHYLYRSGWGVVRKCWLEGRHINDIYQKHDTHNIRTWFS